MVLAPTAQAPLGVRPSELIVGCVVDRAPKFVLQARRLVASIRWFGGELATARILVCTVGEPAAADRAFYESFGAEVRTVERLHAKNPFGNKIRFFEEALRSDPELALLLDCDTIVVRDPLHLLRHGAVQARIAPLPSVAPEVLERVFRRFDVAWPEARYRHGVSGEAAIAYCNSGVVAAPLAEARRLVPAWREYNLRLADELELLHPCEQHCNQAGLSVALAASGVSFEELAPELNYQLNMLDREPAPGYWTMDPAILHYHERVNEQDGSLMPSRYPLAQIRIAAFNRRWRAMLAGEPEPPNRAARAPKLRAAPAAAGAGAAQMLVLGMHRSGTSALARVLGLMGCWAGPEEALLGADSRNPKGYWEHLDVWAIDDAVLRCLGATWRRVHDVDLARLAPEDRERVRSRMREIAESLGRGPWVIKDPRLCLTLPLWREALERPVCVLVHRDPIAVACSLAERDGIPLPVGVALWDLYLRAGLAASRGLPRVLVSYHDLVKDPVAACRRLLADLRAVAPGAVGALREPAENVLREFLDPALDHQMGAQELEAELLDASQVELLTALRDGSALTQDPVPPPSARTVALVGLAPRPELQVDSELDAWRARAERAEAHVDTLHRLLAAALASRSWRLGHAVTRLLRLGAPSHQPSVVERYARWKSALDRRGQH